MVIFLWQHLFQLNSPFPSENEQNLEYQNESYCFYRQVNMNFKKTKKKTSTETNENHSRACANSF